MTNEEWLTQAEAAEVAFESAYESADENSAEDPVVDTHQGTTTSVTLRSTKAEVAVFKKSDIPGGYSGELTGPLNAMFQTALAARRKARKKQAYRDWNMGRELVWFVEDVIIGGD